MRIATQTITVAVAMTAVAAMRIPESMRTAEAGAVITGTRVGVEMITQVTTMEITQGAETTVAPEVAIVVGARIDWIPCGAPQRRSVCF
jgi:hypothetical protein